MCTHAALPLITMVSDGSARVLVGGRDDQGRGQTGFVDLSLRDARVTAVMPDPVVRVGELGTFDDRGALPSCMLKVDSRWLLFYTGVMLGQTVPFYYAVGVAVSEDGERFEKISQAPILDRNEVDPYLVASPCVLHDEGRYRMWYMSGVRWTMEDGRPKHYYHIRYAESPDGLNWKRDGHVCIDFKPGEYAIARPSVVRDRGRYRMWFPYRGDRYKIGYAESSDGLTWERMDEQVTFAPTKPAAWEDDMQCYPWIFDADGERYMAYNGNDYGLTGFGLARLER
jgi:predicted GH43/DUF377 family glycosyl hydrolase